MSNPRTAKLHYQPNKPWPYRPVITTYGREESPTFWCLGSNGEHRSGGVLITRTEAARMLRDWRAEAKGGAA